jgi:hypothetical protein
MKAAGDKPVEVALLIGCKPGKLKLADLAQERYLGIG